MTTGDVCVLLFCAIGNNNNDDNNDDDNDDDDDDNGRYYGLFEIFPSLTVLWNQRRLPPKLTRDFASVGDLLGNNIGDLSDSLVN